MGIEVDNVAEALQSPLVQDSASCVASRKPGQNFPTNVEREKSVKVFVWNRHFTTGLERVDKQHHRLVDLINRLGESLIAANATDDAALRSVFDELADYVKYHFSEEERLMLDWGIACGYRNLHQQHHAQFAEQLSSMWNSRGTMSNPGEVLHGFLCAWLGFHILGEDQEMARQIALIRAGESSDKAFDIAPKPLDNSTAVLLAALRSLYHVLSEQNRDLASANQRLEQRVAERTTELAHANRKLTEFNLRLEALSNTDGLLGIANRRYFDDRLAVEWRRAVRERQAVSLLMIDVDHFKHYNDAYGHQAGDRCLQSVAQAALSAVRRPTDLLARYGGEELVVLLPNTDLNGATLAAQNIRKAISDLHIQHADSPVAGEVTVSIGVAMMTPDQATRSSALIAAADNALYAAKEGGRNRMCAG